MAAGSFNLSNQFLIAMPGMLDDSFAGSVVYLCEHSERGALGLVINKPIDINLKSLFDKVERTRARNWRRSRSRRRPGAPNAASALHEPRAADAAKYNSTLSKAGGWDRRPAKTCSKTWPTAPARSACW